MRADHNEAPLSSWDQAGRIGRLDRLRLLDQGFGGGQVPAAWCLSIGHDLLAIGDAQGALLLAGRAPAAEQLEADLLAARALIGLDQFATARDRGLAIAAKALEQQHVDLSARALLVVSEAALLLQRPYAAEQCYKRATELAQTTATRLLLASWAVRDNPQQLQQLCTHASPEHISLIFTWLQRARS